MKFHKPPFLLKEFKIEVTHRCPLVCVHCSSDASPSVMREMAKDDCIKIIHEAIDLGAEEIAFSGGEPLIWGGLEECIKFASDGGLAVIIYTSGNVNDQYQKLEAVKLAGAEKAVFSIFGSTASQHENITRIRGSFDATIKAVCASIDLGYKTEFHFVPLADNFDDLTDIAKIAKKLGVSRISLLRIVPQGRASLLEGHFLTKLQNVKLRKLVLDLRNKGFDIRTGSPYNFLMLNDQPRCWAAIDRVIIGPEQHVYPCDAFKQVKAEELVGTGKYSNMANYSFTECWGKSPFLEAIRQYLTTPFEEPCESCKTLEKCLSGCLAQKVIANVDLKKRPDPMCLLEKSRD